MITIATVAYLALLSDTPIEALGTPRGRALAMLEVAKRRDGVKWYANDTLVVLRGNDADGYSVTVDGAPIDSGTVEHTISTVKCLVVGLDEPLRPTPTARAYTQCALGRRAKRLSHELRDVLGWGMVRGSRGDRVCGHSHA